MEIQFKRDRPLIISGPCSAESRQQLMDTVAGIAGSIDIIRAGIWKPRTKPGAFEGIGEPGLEWLAEAGKRFNLPTATEVASARHVELALDHGIDILWIGARTTVSPFAVQEIADAVSGRPDVRIMIKNPINPDVELWAGGLERILSGGVQRENIVLIHRGFSSYGKHKYRNTPVWAIPLEMKRRYPDIVMVCDPSHIAGDSAYIREISQTAANLRFDGLMIESHICPSCALSDSRQQLTPNALRTVLGSIVWRSVSAEDAEYVRNLKNCRSEIDEIDTALVGLLARRMEVSDRIGEIKSRNNVAALQESRWADIMDSVVKRAVALGLSEEFISKILETVHIESIDRQNRIMNG